MATQQVLDKQGLQHYATKMCNAENRKVGSKSLPTALNDIDTAIDGFKTLFNNEYGTPVNATIENNCNSFNVGKGNGIDKIHDIENGFSSLNLKGNTLKNLVDLSRAELAGSATSKILTPITDGIKASIDGNTPQTNVSLVILYRMDLSPNTKYTIIGEIQSNLSKPLFSFKLKNGTYTYANTTTGDKNFNITITTDNSEFEGIVIGWHGGMTHNDYFAITRLMVLENLSGPAPDYFTGTRSIGLNNNSIEILSSNRNLLPTIQNFKTWEGYDLSKTLVWGQQYIATTVDHRDIKVSVASSSSFDNGDALFGTRTRAVFTYNSKRPWKFFAWKDDKWTALSDEELNNVQIELAPSTSSFEFIEHKEDRKIIKMNTTLNGIPGKTYDTIESRKDGVYLIQRIKTITFNGSQNFSDVPYTCNDLSLRFDYYFNDSASTQTELICDKMPIYTNGVDNPEVTNFYVAGHATKQRFVFVIPKNKLETKDQTGFKKWLQKNPVKIYYISNTPIETKIANWNSIQYWKEGSINILNEPIPVTTTHTVTLNKTAQIQSNIEELTSLRNRVQKIEEQYSSTVLIQAYETILLNFDMNL